MSRWKPDPINVAVSAALAVLFSVYAFVIWQAYLPAGNLLAVAESAVEAIPEQQAQAARAVNGAGLGVGGCPPCAILDGGCGACVLFDGFDVNRQGADPNKWITLQGLSSHLLQELAPDAETSYSDICNTPANVYSDGGILYETILWSPDASCIADAQADGAYALANANWTGGTIQTIDNYGGPGTTTFEYRCQFSAGYSNDPAVYGYGDGCNLGPPNGNWNSVFLGNAAYCAHFNDAGVGWHSPPADELDLIECAPGFACDYESLSTSTQAYSYGALVPDAKLGFHTYDTQVFVVPPGGDAAANSMTAFVDGVQLGNVIGGGGPGFVASNKHFMNIWLTFNHEAGDASASQGTNACDRFVVYQK